jgi:hypothetical protein
MPLNPVNYLRANLERNESKYAAQQTSDALSYLKSIGANGRINKTIPPSEKVLSANELKEQEKRLQNIQAKIDAAEYERRAAEIAKFKEEQRLSGEAPNIVAMRERLQRMGMGSKSLYSGKSYAHLSHKGGRRTKKHHKKSHKKSRRSHRHRSA